MAFVATSGGQMGPIRRVISVVLALALTTAGFGLLAYLMLAAHGWKGWMVIGSGFAGTVGALWLFDDLFNPKSNHETEKTATERPRETELPQWDAGPEIMATLRDSIRPVHTDKALRQVLMEDFPRDCSNLPIAGGWGYTQTDPIVFVREEFATGQAGRDFVSLEYHIAQKIIYEELVIFRPTDFRFSGIDMKLSAQSLTTHSDGTRKYDFLEFTVTCWSDWHWERLRQEWEESGFGQDPNFDKEAHAGKRNASRIVYARKLWFDVTDVFDPR